MRFSRPGYWSGLPFPSPGDVRNPGIKRGSPALQADYLLTELQGKPKMYGNRRIKGNQRSSDWDSIKGSWDKNIYKSERF